MDWSARPEPAKHYFDIMHSNDKKTIFLTVNRAIVVRNLLLNNFFKLLAEKYRVVLLTPLYDDAQFLEQFGNYDIEPLYQRVLSPFGRKVEQFFISLHKALIYNPTIKVASEYGLMARGYVRFKWLRNNVEKYILGKFFAFNAFRLLVKWIDSKLFTCSRYNEMISKYQPALVFITSLGSDDEVMLLRNCKARRVPSVGMVISWDNLSKYGAREKVDHFIAWSQYMLEEAKKFQCYSHKQVSVVGILQFDNFVMAPYAKNEWMAKYCLDQTKKIILFGSEGPVCADDPYVVSCLKIKIADGTLAGYQILVRPHFAYREDIERFLPQVDNQTVFIDRDTENSKFKDRTGLSLTSVKNLAAHIRYSDVVVTSTSTLVLDVIANGKEPLVYNFDQDKNIPFRDSIRRFYDTLWFREIKKMGLDNMAMSEEDLIAKIKEVAQNPDKDQAKRAKLLDRFCYRVDGRCGERLFLALDKFVQSL